MRSALDTREADLVVADHEEGNRRDFLLVAGMSFAAVGGALVAWPLIDQANPDAAALSLSSVEIDLKPIEEGQSVTVMWRGKPVFIRRRTKAEVEAAKAVKLADLPDGSARNLSKPERAPATDENRTISGHENWLVLIGICTHLGCIPRGQAKGDVKGEYGGWFCPCHGSHYDTSGRIRKGPAPRNLDVPPYAFLNDTRIKIG
ncbi:MAG: ubiquinol-cytochrome c reductase iron-sulfur subunit [Hyphomicrobiaceae bacterium]|nr:MAG: ubiquinol-cytochrome c reductase iron-sulfur subunit [Hyphomicrobiaceae bacterium]